MNYQIRNLLFLTIRLLLYLSVIAAVIFLIISFFGSGGFTKWSIRCGFAVIASVFFYIADIIRKSRFPVAGRDYL
jgi:hypothetical protein